MNVEDIQKSLILGKIENNKYIDRSAPFPLNVAIKAFVAGARTALNGEESVDELVGHYCGALMMAFTAGMVSENSEEAAGLIFDKAFECEKDIVNEVKSSSGGGSANGLANSGSIQSDKPRIEG